MGILSGFEHCVRENEPLGPYTWFHIGGPAAYLAEPTSVDELAALVRRCHDEGVSVRLLGGGSNLLVSAAGVPDMVVSISAPPFAEITVRGQRVRVGGGTKLAHAVSTTVREGLAGLESLVGIPGTVGGALYGNSGFQGTDIGQWCREATVMTRTGEILTRTKDDLRFSYRQSSLDELVILGAEFCLECDDTAELTRRMQKTWIVKRSSQPSNELGHGCIFQNPHGMVAAELIEQTGLKGARVGLASVSDRDANFIIAEPGATADDVQRLIELIRSRVSQTVGVELENQIQIW